MPELTPLIQNAIAHTSHESDGPVTRWLLVSLALTNYVAQIAGGAAIDSAGPFTAFSPTRLPQITLGAGGANPVIYTLTGYRIDDGSALARFVPDKRAVLLQWRDRNYGRLQCRFVSALLCHGLLASCKGIP